MGMAPLTLWLGPRDTRLRPWQPAPCHQVFSESHRVPSMYEPPPVTDEQIRAIELLRSSQRILLTGHERPDGDCVGSQAALACAMNSSGKSAFVMNVDAPASVFSELTALADFRVDSGAALPDHDLVVMLDGGDLSRTGALQERLARAPSKKLVVDHHLHDGNDWWDEAFVDTSASAT